jgi:hypothetical protein
MKCRSAEMEESLVTLEEIVYIEVNLALAIEGLTKPA